MDQNGVMACNPLAIVASIAGTLSFNLVAALGIRARPLALSLPVPLRDMRWGLL